MESSHTLENRKIIILPFWPSHYFNFRVFSFNFCSYKLLKLLNLDFFFATFLFFYLSIIKDLIEYVPDS